MKGLLDENLSHELRLLLTPVHDVFTVAYLGWGGVKNGELLAQAATSGFDVFVTQDQGFEYQQNPKDLPLAVILLQARTNKMDDIRPLVPEILLFLASIKPRSLVKVGSTAT